MIYVEQVPISPTFDKFLLNTYEEGWDLFQPMLHKFKAATDPYPHSHPWDFTSVILKGGYEEEVYSIGPDGTWATEMHIRLPGQSHFVHRNCIHRITRLLNGDCWTLVIPGAGNDDFSWWEWRFEPNGIYRKRHYEQEWRAYEG